MTGGEDAWPEHYLLDNGFYYGTQTWNDEPNGRRIQIAWMNPSDFSGTVWNQQMSFPVEVKLKTFAEGIRVTRLPVDEISSLYDQTYSVENRDISAGDANPFADVSSRLYDIDAEVQLGTSGGFGFTIRGKKCGFGGGGSSGIVTTGPDFRGYDLCAGAVPENNVVRLRILVDEGSITSFHMDGRTAITLYTTYGDDQTVSFAVSGGTAHVNYIHVHTLQSSWDPDWVPPPPTGNAIGGGNRSKIVSKEPGSGLAIHEAADGLYIGISLGGTHETSVYNAKGACVMHRYGSGASAYHYAAAKTPGVYIVKVRSEGTEIVRHSSVSR